MSESCKLVILTVVLLATSALCQLELSASFKVDTQGENIVDKLFNFGQLPNGEKLNPVDYFFEDVLPPLLGQRPNNENGTRAEFKDYALNDKSNDDAVYLSGVSSHHSDCYILLALKKKTLSLDSCLFLSEVSWRGRKH